MAEERLIDADKDKKYRIRKNADGEDELYLATEDDEVAEEEEFEVPVFAYDDEDAATMTPEQLQQRKQQEERAAREREEQIAQHRALAFQAYQQGKFPKTRFEADNVLVFEPTAGDMYCLKAQATLDESGLGSLNGDLREGIRAYATDEQKAELWQNYGERYQQEQAALQAQLAPMERQAEQERAERRVYFKAVQKRAIIAFTGVSVPLLVSAVLTLIFGLQMFSAQYSSYPVLTAIFGGIAAVCFLVDVFLARYLVGANRDVAKNESNKYTKLGRSILALQTKLENLTAEAATFAPSQIKGSL